MSRAADNPIRILHHPDADGWWAESPDVEGWSAAAATYTEVVKLANDGIPLASGHQEATLEHYVPAST